ncbi:MAG: adenosylmethionine--8-amino-7-oxononanoate transaminase [Candidatus Gracilibacteria bacterium]
MRNEIPDNLIMPFSDHRHTANPIVIERGEGAYLYDERGNKYFDGCSSLWVSILGHGHPKVTGKIREQLNKIAHTTLFGQAHTLSIELTEKLIEFVGLPNYSVLYAQSGSEAIEAALKMVMNYWQEKNEPHRKHIVTFEDSYHGETAGAMSVSGFDDHPKGFPHLMLTRSVVSSPVATVKNKAYKRKSLPSLHQFVSAKKDEIAAIIVEPIYGAGGVLLPDDEFFHEIEDICQENGYLLIVDEVATGFYRTGNKFCFQDLQIRPDILVLGKALSAGYLPLSATITAPKIGQLYSRKDRKNGFMHGHTFSGNPLACASAIGNIETLKEEGFVDQIQDLIGVFSEKIARLNHSCVAEKRYKGLFAAIELYGEDDRDWDQAALRTCNEAKEHNVIVRPLGNNIILAPPYVSQEQDIELLLNAVQESINSVLCEK